MIFEQEMSDEQTRKMELGREWLKHINYQTTWSNEEFIAAVRRENMSQEAQDAIAFTLKQNGILAIAEADKMVDGMATDIVEHSVKFLEESAHMTALLLKGLQHELIHVPEYLSALEESLPHTSGDFDERIVSCLQSLIASQKQMSDLANASAIIVPLVARLNPVETSAA